MSVKKGDASQQGAESGGAFSTELALHVLKIFLLPLAITVPILLSLPGLSCAGVAQLVEHLICNQRVGGSIPSASSTGLRAGECGGEISQEKLTGWCLLTRVRFVFPFPALAKRAKTVLRELECARGIPPRFAGCGWASRMTFPDGWVSG